MKVGIIGGGAIGLHMAAQLHNSGKDVTVICRSKEQADIINKDGIQYEGMNHQIKSVGLKSITAEKKMPFDALFITVKQHQMNGLLPSLQSVMDKPIPLVCFQNGIGHEEILSDYFPDAPLFYGITTEGALRMGIAGVRHTGKGTTWFGAAFQHLKNSPFLEELLKMFEDSGMEAAIERNIKERIWKKLITNSCLNPLTALLEIRNGELIEHPSILSIMESLFEEAKIVAKFEGVKIDSSFMQEIVNVCRNTYYNKSSMFQDIEAGRPTEIEQINGAIERIGSRHGFHASNHSLMTKLILAKQEKQ